DPDHRLPSLARLMLEDALKIMAGSGIPVHFSIAPGVPPLPAAGNDWEVAFGGCGLNVVPRTGDPVPAEAAGPLLAQALRPFIESGDFAGAATVALHTIARAERRWGDPLFFPNLPQVAGALPVDKSSPGESAPWGGPLALVVFLIAVVVSPDVRAGTSGRALVLLLRARFNWPRMTRRAVVIADPLASNTEHV